jgi:tRNA (guanine37-N1)-methyltransferase
MMKRAIDSSHIRVQFYNPRDITKNKHNKVDDIPYGGGPGMIMMAEPIIDLWTHITKRTLSEKIPLTNKRVFKTIILSPGGEKFTTQYAKSVTSQYTDIIFICGRYEGIDSRVEQITKAELVSIGDYILTGGELAAMVMIDSISRQIQGVLGNSDSREEERISSHEMYTRPAVLKHKGITYFVPPVLMEGNHKLIEQWRKNH